MTRLFLFPKTAGSRWIPGAGVLVLILAVSVAAAQEPIDGTFLWQGRLNTSGIPASGSHDFQFGLYDCATAGSQVGETTVSLTANVEAGLFTVPLNFGPGAFNGDGRWLEIKVRPAGAGPYTPFGPRQEVTSAPHAGFAANAGTADSVLAATTAAIAATTTHLGPWPADDFTPFARRSITTDTQGLSNHGYSIASTSPLQVTLPVAPEVGSLFRITGGAAGGWQIVQNAGQRILTTRLGVRLREAQAEWTHRENNRVWASVTSSADGMRLVAAARMDFLYTSSDGGEVWRPRDSSRSWQAVASSADGMRLVACVHGGFLYTSSNGGVTWTARETSTARWWRRVASSDDGSRLVACVAGGQIYTSTDFGVTWVARATNQSWEGLASSADGTRLVACANPGQIHTSTDSGATWTPRESSRYWSSVASSSDGTRLIASVNGGLLYISTDSGATWTPRESVRNWQAVASSSDGMRLVACATYSPIQTSRDGGLTWTPRDQDWGWASTASSADGTRLIAAVDGGRIYTSVEPPLLETTPGEAGNLSGGPGTSIALQYIGNDTFLPLSFTGVMEGN